MLIKLDHSVGNAKQVPGMPAPPTPLDKLPVITSLLGF